jgi:uncharacterized protein YrrD
MTSQTATNLEINIGARVYALGRKAGKVDYVIIHPRSMRITDIVVTTGVIGREIVVPVDVIESADKDKVYLSVDEDHLDEFPDFIDVKYEEPPTGWRAPSGIFYAPTDIRWPLGTVWRVNTPEGTRAIFDGQDVVSSDGHKIGVVDAVDVEEPGGRVTGFIVRKGHVLKHDLVFPVGDIEDVRDGKVFLRLTKDQAEQVRQFEGKRQS